VVEGLDGVHDRPPDREPQFVDLCLVHYEVAVMERGQHLVRGVK
jgi:hypothetical protein